jgi:hypothetical protein
MYIHIHTCDLFNFISLEVSAINIVAFPDFSISSFSVSKWLAAFLNDDDVYLNKNHNIWVTKSISTLIQNQPERHKYKLKSNRKKYSWLGIYHMQSRTKTKYLKVVIIILRSIDLRLNSLISLYKSATFSSDLCRSECTLGSETGCCWCDSLKKIKMFIEIYIYTYIYLSDVHIKYLKEIIYINTYKYIWMYICRDKIPLKGSPSDLQRLAKHSLVIMFNKVKWRYFLNFTKLFNK